jgi:M6 family metalloprotease-like protein
MNLSKRMLPTWSALVLLVLGLLAAPVAYAVPANPFPFSVEQPDGQKLLVVMRGDEFQGWMETLEGYSVVRNLVSGFYDYAVPSSSGALQPSGVPAVNLTQGTIPSQLPGLQKGIRPAPNLELRQYSDQFLSQMWSRRLPSTASPSGQTLSTWDPVPVTGSRKVLVILVNFLDATISNGGATYWNQAAFSTTGKSVAKYFADNSYGNVTVTPVTHGQGGNPAGVVSVNLARNHPNCSLHCSFATETSWINAALLAASPFVNFPALDSNGDGVIAIEETLVYFVLAGYEAASTSLTPSIWAHAWGGSGVGVAGKTINHWALNGERYSGTELMRMGTMAHEVGHAMGGLPDLYDIGGTNGGLGYFSLMSAGNWLSKDGEVPGTTPAGLDAWSRQYLGWSSPRMPANGATLSLGSGQTSSTSAVMLRNTALNGSEYWLVENRVPVNWDEGLSQVMGAGWTGGLLIQHLDLNVGSRSSNNFNKYVAGGHQGNMPEEPSTAQCSVLNSGSAGCRTILFYAGNATAFGPATVPNSNFYTGLASGFGVSNISAPSASMTATFATGGAPAGNEFRFGAATHTVGEATASITLAVTRTVTTGAATVAYATANGTAVAGTDYAARSGTLSFAAGVATANIVVPITNDSISEGNETFSVALSAPSIGTIGAPGATTVTIIDNDVPSTVSFGAATYSVGEATASLTIPITRSSTVGTARVAYTTANGTATAGTDYTARTGTATFAAGVATVNIAVPITNDTVVEGNETFTVALSSPVGMTLGATPVTTVTIIDNDVPSTVSFGAATYSVGEATASLTIPITRSSTVGTARVAYTTANGTATAGTDYTARTGTATFAAGVATVNIAVPITNDTVVEGNETFTVALSSPVGMTLGATPVTTVTIIDNDVPSTVSFGAATYSVGEATASLTIPITRSSTVGTARVAYTTANGTATAGTDYTARTGTATFAAGVATVNIAVPITNDTVVEGNETFTVALSSPVGMTLGATPVTTVTIIDNDSGSSTYRLSVFRSGNGGVASTPAGIDCVPGSACSASFTTGSTVTLLATPGSGWAFNRWSGACSGTAPSCVVSMTSAKAAVAIFTTSSLGAALDNTTLPWTTQGNAPWQPQSSVWMVGGSALQSGVVADSQDSIVQTSVTGPGLLTFRWRVSSESGYDFLTFGFDGWDQWYMSGESGWHQQSWFIPEGTHVLTWTYRKDGSVGAGSDTGWLDEVIFTSGNQTLSTHRTPMRGLGNAVRQNFGPVLSK